SGHQPQGSVAGVENGRVASTTNITREYRSTEPLLLACMAVSGAWPASALPAPIRFTPWGVLNVCSPDTTYVASDPGWLCTGVTLPGAPLASLTRNRYSGAGTV